MDKQDSKQFRFIAATLIGGAPIWMILLIWDFTEQRPGWSMFVRFNSLVIPLVEFIFILCAMAVGFSPLRTVANLPWTTKFAVGLWLVIVSLTSFQLGNDHVNAAMALMKLFFAGLTLLALVDLRQRSQDDLLVNIWLGVGCAFVAFIPLWILHITITQPAGFEWVIHVPAVANVRHIGHFAFASFCAGIVCFIAYRGNISMFWRWVVPVMFSALGLGVALWTGSRGPTLAVITVIIFMLLMGSKLRRPLSKYFTISVLVATVAIAPLPVPHPIFGISGALGITDLLAEADHDAGSGRAALWRETGKKIVQKPVFGWGLEQFATQGPKESLGVMHPHNFLLQILFSVGIIGTVLPIFIMFSILQRWRWPDRSQIGSAGVASVAGLTVYSMFDGVFFFSYPIMLLFLAIATSIASRAQICEPDK